MNGFLSFEVVFVYQLKRSEHVGKLLSHLLTVNHAVHIVHIPVVIRTNAHNALHGYDIVRVDARSLIVDIDIQTEVA